MNELVDVLDEDGRVVGVVTRSRVRADNLRHRSVGIAVLDRQGRVLIHRRADDKDVWPGRWDLACGGVVAAGETYEAAAQRELAEELGIEGVELQHLGDGSFADDTVNAVVRLFHVTWDGPLRFADGEVVEAVWVDAAELRARLRQDSFVPDSVALASAPIAALLAERRQ